MAALDVPADLIPGKNRTANPPSPPFLPDSINLSTQGEKPFLFAKISKNGKGAKNRIP